MSRPVNEDTKLGFSKEHIGKSSKEPEVDSQRQKAGESKVEKTGHNSTPTQDVNIDKK